MRRYPLSSTICTAPSAAPACGFGGGAAFTGIGFEYPKAKAISGANAPENKIEKKLRNAKEILFKMLSFYPDEHLELTSRER